MNHPRRSVLKWLTALPFVGGLVPPAKAAQIDRPASGANVPQYYELVNGEYVYRGYMIDYFDRKTWPPFTKPLEQWVRDNLIWGVRQYFPTATVTFDDRGVVVSDQSWSFVACSQDAIDAVGSYANVFITQNVMRAAGLKIGSTISTLG
jgi:hypothetical protein